jgi:CheY-like chemotaxis protein
MRVTLPFGQLRILVAENDRMSQKLMVQTLEKMGMAVVSANDGNEALERFAADHFDLIFMDLALPGMDGFAATAAILRHENASHDDDHAPIIAVTSHAGIKEHKRCLAAGMDSYIEKPANLYQLQIALRAFANPDSLRLARRPPTWNRAQALERLGGDETLLSELIAVFAEEKFRLVSQMDRALLERKPALLQEAARILQAELNYLGDSEVSETARKLEATAGQTDFLAAAEMVGLLRFQLSATNAAMSGNGGAS